MTQQTERRNFSPVRGFASVFVSVFLLIFLASGVVTFMLPESFVAVARVKVGHQELTQVFDSDEVLRRVCTALELPNSFARQFGQQRPVPEDRALQMLRRLVQVRRSGTVDVMEVRVVNRSPELAAQLANAVAESGTAAAKVRGGGDAQLLERAVPPSKAARPNKPLNLALGALVGVILGAMAGGVGARLAVGPDPDALKNRGR